MRMLFVLALGALPAAAQTSGGTVSGELRKWHRVTISFDGPSTGETASTNPFRNYRLDVTFAKGTRSIKVPGFYAADGNAAETSAASGNKWRVHFTPDEEGTWSYSASFRTGTDIAISTSATAGSATAFNGASGSFNVGATNKTGRDHRGKGRLRYVGRHHLQFAQTGEWFIKGGADSPENFLAFYEFDGTPTTKHKYLPHAGDWKTGDPSWKGGKGKNIIGALNYLSGKGMNSVYFLTMNVQGDGKDVWPWTSDTERYRFDVSKLDQWEIVLSHMDRLGIQLHVVTQETENDQLLDGGELGTQRKLYYRELVARFAHHLGVVWNIGEETTNTDAQRKDFANWIRGLDPYDHPIVVHTYPNQYDTVYTPLLGHPAYEGPSLQMGSRSATHSETVKWVQKSAASGRRWFVCLDEIGPAGEGVKPDADDFWHDSVRTQALWGNLMGGGAGCEWYFGYNFAHHDLTCEDWRSRDHMWDLTRIAMDFFRQHLPFQDMTPNDGLVSTGWCLNKGGEVYAVYLPSGGTASLNVGAGTYSVQWFDPRNGGALLNGSVTSITGSGSKPLGNPPNNSTKDWAVLVKLSSGTGDGGGGGATSAVTSFTLINADSDLDIGTLADGQSINLATLPTRNLNVRANVSGTVGSVRFGYDGNANYKTESVAPYALAGDTNGDYNAWTPTVGSHTLRATPYTEAGGGGTAGTALTISFTVVDDAANTPPSVSITSPANNATFVAGANITITASASDPDGTVSFVDFYRGTTLIGMDTTSPWSVIWSNVPAGTYVLTAKATDDDAATATSGPVTITVTASGGQAVDSLTLINADTNQPIAGFNPIASGATIDLDALPTRNLNMRANTSPATVGSVRFGYDANANVRTENAAPYALAGDSSGNYYAWTPSTGSHSVTATPYTGSNASGTAGTARTITFTVTSSTATAASAAPSDPGATGPESGSGTTGDGAVAPSEDRDGGIGANCGALGLEIVLGLGLAAMVRSRRRLGWAVAALALLGAGLSADAQVYQESGGIVVIEVESHPTAGSWVKETSIAGYTGSGYYRWNGANSFNTGGNGTLTYRINITNAGEYQLRLRNYHNHPTDNTLENDCFTKMDGGNWIKTYSSSGNANKWNWATTHEPTSGTHLTPKYTLGVGEHTFYISGRSTNFRIDRFHLHLPNVSGATDETRPESLTTAGSGGGTGGGDTGGGSTGGGTGGSGTDGSTTTPTLPSGPDRPNDPDGCGGRIAAPGASWAWLSMGLLLLLTRRR